MKAQVKFSAAVVAFSAVLLGCNGSSNVTEDDIGTLIWTAQSERILLTRFNGYTVNEEDRYSVYDLSRDTLTAEALEVLDAIKTTVSDLGCSEDQQSFDVVITDGSGMEQTFYSDNRVCNNIEADGFIALEQLNSFVESLND